MNSAIPVFLGTYTRKEGHVDGKASGVYGAKLDQETGSLTVTDSITDIINPSYVWPSNDRQMLYAVSEIGEGLLYYYQVSADQSVELMGQLPTGAPAPCHIAIDATDTFIAVSNYMGGIVNLYRRISNKEVIETDRLLLNEVEATPESHAHSVTFSPDNRFAYIADLGKDRIWNYTLDATAGKLNPNPEQGSVAVAAGAGPRHFKLHPNGRFAYVINELNSTMTAFARDPESGVLTELQTLSTLPDDYTGPNSCADVHVHASGKFLYGSNRGHNTIVVYAIDEAGQLTLVEHVSTNGDFPRNFAISPDGKFLYAANQNTDNITQYRLDESTGKLSPVGETKVPTPVCIAFAESFGPQLPVE